MDRKQFTEALEVIEEEIKNDPKKFVNERREELARINAKTILERSITDMLR